jgi:N-acyl-D-aspartate/D-glutamate deacylase
MRKPWVATASDWGVATPGEEKPHPRAYGTFARKIGVYAVEEKIVALPAAVRSCSGLPAEILGLDGRGVLRTGAWADVVVFDPATYRDRATFDDPHRYAEGVRWVLVNGVTAVEDGKETGAAAGRVLRLAEQARMQK